MTFHGDDDDNEDDLSFFFFFIKKKRFYSRRTEHAFNLDGNVRLMNTNRSSLLRRSFPTLSRCLPTFPLYLSSFLSLPLSLFTPHQHLWFLYKVSHSIQTKNSLYFNGQKYLETFIFSTFFFFPWSRQNFVSTFRIVYVVLSRIRLRWYASPWKIDVMCLVNVRD